MQQGRAPSPLFCPYAPNMSDAMLTEAAKQLRMDVLELTYFSGTQSSHVGGELSAADIIAVLYGRVLNLRPEEPRWEGRDRFILSKGHCSGIQYAAMAWRGFFPREWLWTKYNRPGDVLQEHANMELPGIEAPTGSLGMGLSNACGMAWAAKLRGMEHTVCAMLGDGECTEGQVWEAAMCASQLKLSRLVAIVDYNHYIISGPTHEIMELEPFADKWESFGFEVLLMDGHDIPQISHVLDRAFFGENNAEKPRVIIADTIKGKGIPFMEKDAVNWHAGHLDGTLLDACRKELMI